MGRILVTTAVALLALAPGASAFRWPIGAGGPESSAPIHPNADLSCNRLATPLVVLEVSNGFGCFSPAVGERDQRGRRLVIARAQGDRFRVNGMPVRGSALAWWYSDADGTGELMVKIDGSLNAPAGGPAVVTLPFSGTVNANQEPREVAVGSGELALAGLGSPQPATFLVGVDGAGRRHGRVESSVSLEPFQPHAAFALQSNDRDGEPRDFRIQGGGFRLGRLKFGDLCLAHSQQAGLGCGGVERPFAGECGVDEGTWSGSLTMALPGGASVGGFGAFNGNGVVYAGGQRGFGYEAPLGQGVYLDHIAAQVCRQPDWLLQGQMDIRFGPNDLPGGEAKVNGDFVLYPNTGRLDVFGTLEALGIEFAEGEFHYVPPASVAFTGGIDEEFGPLSISGRMSGFFDPDRQAAQARGDVTVGLGAGGMSFEQAGEAIVSTAGIGACVQLADIDLGFFTIQIKAGAGMRWGGVPKIMATSCGLGAWDVSGRRRSALPRQSVALTSFDVGSDRLGVGVRVRGTGAPPKVALLSPDGKRIIRTTEVGVAQGSHAVLPAGNDVLVMIAQPQQGTWRVIPHDDAPPVAGVDTSDYTPPPPFEGSVADRGSHELLTYRYAAHPRYSVRLQEEGDGAFQDLGHPQGVDCPDDPKSPIRGAEVQCAKLRFTPVPGAAGPRRIVAMVRDARTGNPVDAVEVARFHAEAEELLPAPRPVEVVRDGTRVAVRWRGVPAAEAYDVVLTSSHDELELAEVDGADTSATFTGIGRDSRVRVVVTAVSPSGQFGREAIASEGGTPYPGDCDVGLRGADPSIAALRRALDRCAAALRQR